MIRATTPTHTYEFDINAAEFSEILVTYQQLGKTIFEKHKSDFTITGKSISIKLTETETKQFIENANVAIQVRCVLNGNSMASEIFQIPVHRVLNDVNLLGD